MTIEPKKLEFTCAADEFKIAVQGCGVRVEISADGNVTIFSNRPTRLLLPDATDTSVQPLKTGAVMPDGSIYAGVSPDTGNAMYATPKDAPLCCTFNQARQYASKLDVHGREDWRVPTKAELNELFLNRAAIGGFDTRGSSPASWYWSSSFRFDDNIFAWAQRFSDGRQSYGHRAIDPVLRRFALRCVRG